MKVAYILLTGLLLPLRIVAQESGGVSWSMQPGPKPMPPASMKFENISLREPAFLEYPSIGQNSRLAPSLQGMLLVNFARSQRPQSKSEPAPPGGVAPAEKMNIRVMRTYQKRVEGAIRSLSSVPTLYPETVERANVVIER